MSVLCLIVLIVTAVSAASVYESTWHLQPNSVTVTAESARLDRLRFDVRADLASVQFRDGALCVATQDTNADIDVVATPLKGSVAMRLRLRDPRAAIYELFLIARPWSLSVFKFNYDDNSSRVGVFPPAIGGFHDKRTPLDGGNTTLPSDQHVLWVVFTWNPQLMVAPAAVWWNLDGKFNSSSTVSLHSGVPNAMSDYVSFFVRYQTSVCIEALVVSNSTTDPQKALVELEFATRPITKGDPLTTATTRPITKGDPLTTATTRPITKGDPLTTATTTTTAVTPVPDEITTGATTATATRTLGHTPSGTSARLTQAAPRPGLDGGILGAIIGGCIAGLFVVAVIVFVVLRRRTQSRSVATAGVPPRQPTSEYGSLSLKPNDEYESTLTLLK
jgi:hypothetical protein